LLVGLLLALAHGLCPAPALAQDFQAFEEAHQAYVDGSYALAVRLFEALVGGEVPALSNEVLVLESRKYLGAAYLFVDRRAEAETQFRRLLEQDPTYEMDPVAFSRDVVQVFVRVRDQVRQRLTQVEDRLRQEEAERRRLEAARLLRERERAERLQELAQTEVETVHRSRLVATIPFGVGQFQNGDTLAGWLFAVSEGVLAIASVTTAILWRSLDPRYTATLEADFLPAEEQLRLSNQVVTAALAAVMLGGIIHAHLRFVPESRETRRRDLPEDLEPGVEVTAGPLGLSVRF